jgi:hypothetical protein
MIDDDPTRLIFAPNVEGAYRYDMRWLVPCQHCSIALSTPMLGETAAIAISIDLQTEV